MNKSLAKLIVLALAVLGPFFFVGQVRAAVENIYSAQAIFLNDPGFTTDSADADKQWALARTNFVNAWEKTTGSGSTVIAVIDSGVDVTHADLQTINFVPGFNFLTDQPIPDGVNSDDNGHGTMVAGIIGASPNNSTGVVGANWQVSIMPLKVLDANGNGVSSTVAKAITYATDHGAHIINLSLGGSGYEGDELLAQAIRYAYEKGLIIVAAAGNDTQTNGINLDISPSYPACQDNDANMVIGVAAIDNNDYKPAFSNYGSHCVDVVAPGKRILSTINKDPISGKPAPNSYAYASGTSLAAPYVSAEAALIRAINPGASNKQIRDIILKAVDPVDYFNLAQCGGYSCNKFLGSGRINVSKAVNERIVSTSILEGDLVQLENGGEIYYVNGGKKQRVSEFVLIQRFGSKIIKRVTPTALIEIPDGTWALPKEGSLVKELSSPTIYFISAGSKQPVTLNVFKSFDFNFGHVSIVSKDELNSWLVGKFLAPKEGSLVRGVKGATVYWVVNKQLHPINGNFYKQRGLNYFPIFYVPDSEIGSYAVGEAYIL